MAVLFGPLGSCNPEIGAFKLSVWAKAALHDCAVVAQLRGFEALHREVLKGAANSDAPLPCLRQCIFKTRLNAPSVPLRLVRGFRF